VGLYVQRLSAIALTHGTDFFPLDFIFFVSRAENDIQKKKSTIFLILNL
jgi:hypothetical protein